MTVWVAAFIFRAASLWLEVGFNFQAGLSRNSLSHVVSSARFPSIVGSPKFPKFKSPRRITPEYKLTRPTNEGIRVRMSRWRSKARGSRRAGHVSTTRFEGVGIAPRRPYVFHLGT